MLIKSVLNKGKVTTTIKYVQKNIINQLKNKKNVHTMIILSFREKEIAEEKFYTSKKPIEIWDVNVNNILVSKLVKTKN